MTQEEFLERFEASQSEGRRRMREWCELESCESLIEVVKAVSLTAENPTLFMQMLSENETARKWAAMALSIVIGDEFCEKLRQRIASQNN